MMPQQVRGFRYAIEPAYRRALWHRDAAQQALARAQRETDTARAQLRDQQDALRAQAQQVATHWHERLDPHVRGCALGHLVQARERMQQATLQVERLEATRTDALQDCQRSEARLDLMASHRERCLHAHLREQDAQAGRQADDQWITSLQWQRRQGKPR